MNDNLSKGRNYLQETHDTSPSSKSERQDDLQEAHEISQPGNETVQSQFETLTDTSPLDGDNLVLALFHSYVWNLTTYFVACYWKIIVWLFGLVRYLEDNLSPTLAFVISYLLLPVLFQLDLQYTTDAMNGHRRFITLIVSTLSTILQSIILQTYHVEFSKLSLAIPPFVFASCVPLLAKWFGYNRYIVLGGTTVILFSFYSIYGMICGETELDFMVWSFAFCLVSAIVFQMKVASLRASESLCSLNEVGGLNLYGIVDILLTRLYAS